MILLIQLQFQLLLTPEIFKHRTNAESLT